MFSNVYLTLFIPCDVLVTFYIHRHTHTPNYNLKPPTCSNDKIFILRKTSTKGNTLYQDINLTCTILNIYIYIYRMSQEGGTKLRESVPYVKIYRYNPKHLYPKLNGYGDNGQRSLKL